MCGFDSLAVVSAVLLPGAVILTGRARRLFWFRTNGANEEIGTRADGNHTRSQLKPKLACNVRLIKSKCDHFDSAGAKPPTKCFWNYMWVSAALERGPKTKKKKSMRASSSGRCFLILNGCWLLAFCVSWKKLDKAEVWEDYFSSRGLGIVCDSRGTEAPRSGPA